MDPDPDADPDADPDPSIFIIDRPDANKKLILKNKFFCVLLFEGTFTSFFKEKSQKEVTEQSKSILLNDRRIRIQEAQKHVDPDPQH
jgi:hypothetical protein